MAQSVHLYIPLPGAAPRPWTVREGAHRLGAFATERDCLAHALTLARSIGSRRGCRVELKLEQPSGEWDSVVGYDPVADRNRLGGWSRVGRRAAAGPSRWIDTGGESLRVGLNRSSHVMSDDTKQRGPADGKRISLSEDYEVRYWTEALGVTEERLRAVVDRVGPMAEDVRRALDKS